MSDRIQVVNGKPYVVAEIVISDEPIVRHLWYPIHSSKPHPWPPAAPEAGDYVAYVRGEGWVAYREVGDDKPRIRTGAVWTDSEPTEVVELAVPCPKVKAGIKTHWKDGRWRKLMKRGWVDA